jgi:hypothetical protein
MKTSVIISSLIIVSAAFFSGCTSTEKNERITIDGTRFVVNGNEIFMNGVNTPWDNWNDFGGEYDPVFWDSEFQRIREWGGNCSRIWISCDGDVGIEIDSNGVVSGATEKHWNDLESMFAFAQKHKVYIMATLLSFDHTKASHKSYPKWRKMIASKENVDSYVANYVVPFVNRFKYNPYLWCIDACNEIEWVNQDRNNAQAPWEDLQYLVGSMAVAVHENSDVLFTLGSAAVKWNCDLPGDFEGNFWSDEQLQAQVNSPQAFPDFYSPHYYGWVVKYFGSFTDLSPADYGLNDRPCIIGENPGGGVFMQTAGGKDSVIVPIEDAFIRTYENGWKGLMVWTSNGVDRYGDISISGPGLKAFAEKYPELVDPKSQITNSK